MNTEVDHNNSTTLEQMLEEYNELEQSIDYLKHHIQWGGIPCSANNLVNDWTVELVDLGQCIKILNSGLPKTYAITTVKEGVKYYLADQVLRKMPHRPLNAVTWTKSSHECLLFFGEDEAKHYLKNIVQRPNVKVEKLK